LAGKRCSPIRFLTCNSLVNSDNVEARLTEWKVVEQHLHCLKSSCRTTYCRTIKFY
jgi:hypothetical protein